MASQTFEVHVEGLDVLRRKLDTKRILGPVKQEMIKEAGDTALKTAQTEFKGRAGTGGIARTVKQTIEQDGMVSRIDVPGVVARTALSIEQGRPPGRNVPYKALTSWAARAGMDTSRPAIRELRAQIKQRGTTGTHAMQHASEKANATLRTKQPATERHIEADFNR